ncbi:MAG: SH3 domain-containing protein [Clostridia bacterium]|nr:SH3 domain-containing protein [Clostridia bacterium]
MLTNIKQEKTNKKYEKMEDIMMISKKMIRCISCILMLILLLSVTPALAEKMIVYTRGGPVVIRKTPNMDDRSNVSVPKGEEVEIIEYVNNKFVKVRWKEYEGYLPLQYVKTETEILGKEYPKGKNVYPDEPMVYVREAASDASDVIAAVKWDQPITILKEGNGWHKVACVNQSGQSVVGYIKASAIASKNAQPVGGNLFQTQEKLREEGEAVKELTLREFPDVHSEVCATVPQGHSLTVLDIQEPWCYVAVDAYVGWVHVGNVRMTGKQTDIFDRESISDYKASYYTASSVASSVTLYAEPTKNLKTNSIGTYDAKSVSQWIVMQRTKNAYGQTWTLLWDGSNISGWALSKDLNFSTERKEWDYGDESVSAYTSAIAYVKEGGAAFYEAGTDLSKKMLTIPAGTELEISLHPGNYAFTSYGGKSGYVSFSQIETGFAWDRDWWNKANNHEEVIESQPMIDKEVAKATAETTLKSKYATFDPAKFSLKTETERDSAGINHYSFAYYQGDDCLYLARVNAFTGNCDYQADYTAFVLLSGGDNAVDWDPNAPQKQPKATDRPSSTGDVGMKKARSAADQAIKNEFKVNLNKYTCSQEYQQQMPGFDGPVYRFNYYADNGYLLCVVSAESGKAVYTSNVYNAENTEIDYNPPKATAKPDHSKDTLMSQSEARKKADAALRKKYAAFSGTTFSSVTCHFYGDEQGDPTFGENYYQFDYYVNGNATYSCIVNGYTGKILYLYGDQPGEGNG